MKEQDGADEEDRMERMISRGSRLGMNAVFLLFAAVFLLFHVSPAQAAVFDVADGDAQGLIDAMDAANANGEADTIRLADNGAYTLTEVDNTGTNGPNGLPLVTSGIAIEGNGATIERSGEDGIPQFRIFNVPVSGDLLLEDVTVAGGDSRPNRGGGILNRGALTITDSTVSDNNGGTGGGLGSLNGEVTVTDTTVSGNAAVNLGGGLDISSTDATVTDSTVSGNTAGGSGGGMHNSSSGNLTVTRSAVTGNTATFHGGGVSSSTTGANLGDPASRTTITNSTISGNRATNNTGGGVYNANGRTEISHATITDNQALQDRGQGVSSRANLNVRTVMGGSIVAANNSAGPDVAMFGSPPPDTFESAGHNLTGTLGPGVNAFTDGEDGDQVGVANPSLAALAQNGGPTQTHALQTGSPAIGNADPEDFPETDQRGVPRPQGAGPDVGAFEQEPQQPAPAVGLDPQSVDFGNQRVDAASDPETVTITNTGDAELDVGSVALDGTDAGEFSIESEDCTTGSIAAKDGCTVNLTFSPTTTGDKDATLAVASDAPGNPHTAALSGTGTSPAVELDPQGKDFGEQPVGDGSDPRQVALTNTGDAPLEISSVEIIGPQNSQFSKTSDECGASTLAPDQSCVVEVAFEPDSPGDKQATLSFESDAPGGPHEVALSGTGVAAAPPPDDPDPTDTTLTLSSGKNIILFGQSVGLSGKLADEGGQALSGKQVILERRFTNQQQFQQIGTLTTNNNGVFSTGVSPPRNAVFRARFTGGDESNPSAAATRVSVRALVNLNLSRSSVSAGQNVMISGNVRPVKNSFAVLTIRRGGKVVLNRRVNLNNQGRYRFVYRVPARGNHLVQVRFPGDRDNLANAASQRFRAVVNRQGVSQAQSQQRSKDQQRIQIRR